MQGTFGKAVGALALATALGLAATSAEAQPQAPGTGAPAPGQGAGSAAAGVPDATVQRTGAVLRDLSEIQTRFTQRMQNAQPAEHPAIEQEANGAAQAALASRGLTVDEYNGVIRLAQADQGLRERLVKAARDAQ
jgi:hypothetical protein